MSYFIWISFLFSPLFDLGIRVRADQLLCPLYFVIYLVVHRSVHGKNPVTLAVLAYALVSGAASLLGVWANEDFSTWSAVKWPFLFLTNAMAALTLVWSRNRNRPFLYLENLFLLQRLVFFVGLIGLLQVAEHRNLLNSSRVTDLLSTYYPYWGELSDSAYEKSFGMQLKVGGAGQLTSVVDGHPILAGDLLAFCLLITMPLVRGSGWMLHAVPAVALILTLSRGSIGPWFIGVLVYCGLIMRHCSNAGTARKSAALWLIAPAIFFCLLLMSPLGETVFWRIQSSVDTIQGTGVADGRTEIVWPEVMDLMRESTNLEILFGRGDAYDGPTDSQYLYTLVGHGVVGLTILVIFHIALIVIAYRQAMNCLRERRPPELAFAFVAAVSALMLMYIAHPAYENRRLLSLLVATAVLLLQAEPNLLLRRKPQEFRRATHYRPSFQRA